MNSIQIHVKSQYNNLSKAEQKVADYFLEHSDEIYTFPIAELSKRSGVSSGTWVRFCKSIGFQGLKELKHVLFHKASEGKESSDTDQSLVFTDIKDHKNSSHIVESIRASSIQAINNTLQLLDAKTVEKAAEMLFHANSIRLFGVGASGLVAMDFAHKLLRIGFDAIYIADLHVQLTLAATMQTNDVAVIISNSGATKEMVEIQELIKKNKVKDIAISSIGKNPLSQEADLVLQTSSPEIHLRSGAMSSRIAQLAVVDAVFTTLANKNYLAIENLLEKSYQVSLPHRTIMRKE